MYTFVWGGNVEVGIEVRINYVFSISSRISFVFVKIHALTIVLFVIFHLSVCASWIRMSWQDKKRKRSKIRVFRGFRGNDVSTT
jgi:hypothetical protein